MLNKRSVTFTRGKERAAQWDDIVTLYSLGDIAGVELYLEEYETIVQPVVHQFQTRLTRSLCIHTRQLGLFPLKSMNSKHPTFTDIMVRHYLLAIVSNALGRSRIVSSEPTWETRLGLWQGKNPAPSCAYASWPPQIVYGLLWDSELEDGRDTEQIS